VEILRATDTTGEVYDDPSEDALFMFIEDMVPGSSLRVDRLEKAGKASGRKSRSRKPASMSSIAANTSTTSARSETFTSF